MASITAATAALGRKRRLQKQKAAAKLSFTTEKTSEVAALYDAEAGAAGVTREQTRRVMAALAPPGAAVNVDDLDMVRRRACNYASAAAGVAADPAVPERDDGPPLAEAQAVDEGDAALEKAPLVEATVRWAAYLDHKDAVDALYAKFSRARLGQLTPAELQRALESAERKAGTRDCFGIIFEVLPSKSDVRRVISLCDVDQDGYINKIEIISALHAWRRLAAQHAKAQSEVCVCM